MSTPKSKSAPIYFLNNEPVSLDVFLTDHAKKFEPEEVDTVRKLLPGEALTYPIGGTKLATLRRAA